MALLPDGMDDKLDDYVIGVVSDTHVPDRVGNLHPELLSGLRSAGVKMILHAGDVCEHSVIEQLESIAPVIAVQGNRDFFLNEKSYQTEQKIIVNDTEIGLMHGHGGFWRYVYEKFEMASQGYRFTNYYKLMVKTFPHADIIVYGHTHNPENVRVGDKLIFNPGSAGIGGWRKPPSYGLLTIQKKETFYGKIIPLGGAKRLDGKWVQIP